MHGMMETHFQSIPALGRLKQEVSLNNKTGCQGLENSTPRVYTCNAIIFQFFLCFSINEVVDVLNSMDNY